LSDKVLVISAHADDEVLGVGGTITKHVEAGDVVNVVIVSNREGIGDDEKEHAVAAQNILGYDHLQFLDFKDMDLDHNIIRFLNPLEDIYSNIEPNIVYTHHHGDNNQDHRAVFEATSILCRPQRGCPPRKLLTYEVPSSTDQAPSISPWAFQPNHFVTLSDVQHRKKIYAFNCYSHQVRTYPESSRSRKGIETLSRYRGLQCQVDFAEALTLIRGIDL
jgi:LmbE family N-acetylglucosaminyl deacetylase